MLSVLKTVTLIRRPKIALAAIVILITILRETGAIDLDFYHSRSYHQANSSIQESSLTSSMDSTDLEGIPHENITTTPIVVLDGGDTLFFRRGYGRAIELTFENLDTGPIWLPLYKHGNLHAKLRCHYHGGWNKRQGAYITAINMTFSGDIHIVGNVTIIGPCAYKTSLNLLKQSVANAAVERIETRLQELENLFESRSNPALLARQLLDH